MIAYGELEYRSIGKAKLYTLTKRLPLESLLWQTEDYLIITDNLGKVIQIDERTATLFGCPVEQIKGKPFGENSSSCFFTTNGSPVTARQIAETGSRELMMHNGELITHFNQKTLPIVLSDGSPGNATIITDITELRRVEDALHIKEFAIESSINAIALADLSGNINYINPSFLSIWGYKDPQEILGRSMFSLWIVPDEAQQIADRLLVQGTWSGEIAGQRKDGTPIQVQLLANLIRNTYGSSVAIMGSFLDITEHKLGEEALKESEEKYRTLVEKANEAIIIIQDGIVVFANQRMSDLLGVPVGDLKGRPFIDFIWPDDREMVMKNYKMRVAGENIAEAYDFRIIGAGGRLTWILLSEAEIQWKGKQATLTMLTDITERKKAEEALQTLTVELESRVLQRTAELEQEIVQRKNAEATIISSLHEKEILLDEIHHRVKHNLQIITSLIRLQKNQNNPDSINALENRIRSIALVHERLYSSEDFTSIDFANYTRSLATSLIHAYAINPDRIRMVIDFKDVSLDIKRAIPMGLIMNELVANALKHAFPGDRNGEITITGRCTPTGIVLSVQDNGVGLPDGMDWRNTPTLGLQLVIKLIQQVDGSIEKKRTIGTAFEMNIQSAKQEIS
jgi:PAS domain S-box-containing protein